MNRALEATKARMLAGILLTALLTLCVVAVIAHAEEASISDAIEGEEQASTDDESSGEYVFANGDAVAVAGDEETVSADDPDAASSEDGLSAASENDLSAMAMVSIQTGSLSETKPTRAQIRAKLLAITPFSLTRYKTTPSLSGTFAPGSLPNETLENGLDWLNYVRYVAGLPDVTLDSTLNASAQYGALVQAANNSGLSHTPSQPSGMATDTFNQGYYASRTGNLSAGGGSPKSYADSRSLGALSDAITGQIDDSSSTDNLTTVGHRRWLLNPALTTTGMGSVSATSASGSFFWYYSCIRVFNYTGDSHYSTACGTVGTSGSVDYQAICWPSSGYMPNNVFSAKTPWSITLNPSKYKTSATNLANAEVMVTRDSDGKTWTLDSNDNDPTTTGEGFTVNTGGYGVSNAIIFSLGTENLGTAALTGKYTVTLSGIYQTGSTAQTTVTYDVDFFDPLADLSKCTITLDKDSYDYTGSQIKPTVTVKNGSTPLAEGTDYTLSYSNNTNAGTATAHVTGAGNFAGTKDASFTINPVVTRLAGSNALGTMTEVVGEGWGKNSCTTAIVATNDGYWDALTGAALCGKNRAPLVLASNDDRSAITGFVNANVLSTSRAYVLGGTAAVSDETAQAVKSVLLAR